MLMEATFHKTQALEIKYLFNYSRRQDLTIISIRYPYKQTYCNYLKKESDYIAEIINRHLQDKWKNCCPDAVQIILYQCP